MWLFDKPGSMEMASIMQGKNDLTNKDKFLGNTVWMTESDAEKELLNSMNYEEIQKNFVDNVFGIDVANNKSISKVTEVKKDKNSELWNSILNLDRTIINDDEIVLPDIGYSFLYSFFGKILLRIGRIDVDKWILQIKYMDERFRVKNKNYEKYSYIYNSLYFYNIRITSCCNPSIGITDEGLIFYMQGIHKKCDNNTLHFCLEKYKLIDLLLAIRSWSKNWEGWKVES